MPTLISYVQHSPAQHNTAQHSGSADGPLATADALGLVWTELVGSLTSSAPLPLPLFSPLVILRTYLSDGVAPHRPRNPEKGEQPALLQVPSVQLPLRPRAVSLRVADEGKKEVGGAPGEKLSYYFGSIFCLSCQLGGTVRQLPGILALLPAWSYPRRAHYIRDARRSRPKPRC